MTDALPDLEFIVDHLLGRRLPDVELHATDGTTLKVSTLYGLTVFYMYPRTSPPNGPAIARWSDIPGAKGCTPQSCGFRDHFAELQAVGVENVFGVSTQSTDYQSEVVDRLHLPFALLSDAELKLQRALNLPTFSAADMVLLHRLTLIARDGIIEKVFHGIIDPAANATDVLDYLSGT
ncbi:MAG: peroxiredoxin [Albidovulum sp.]